jgi:hypothetical protein
MTMLGQTTRTYMRALDPDDMHGAETHAVDQQQVGVPGTAGLNVGVAVEQIDVGIDGAGSLNRSFPGPPPYLSRARGRVPGD